MDLLTKAKSLAERVEAEATKADVPVAVCIIDVHGNLVLQHRMSGAPVFALEISERTVKFHVTALFNKPGADNRAQAVAIAAERGLLSSN